MSYLLKEDETTTTEPQNVSNKRDDKPPKKSSVRKPNKKPIVFICPNETATCMICGKQLKINTKSWWNRRKWKKWQLSMYTHPSTDWVKDEKGNYTKQMNMEFKLVCGKCKSE